MTASIAEAGHLVARDAPASLARLIAALLVDPRVTELQQVGAYRLP